MTRWMGKPPVITPEHYARLLEIRAERRRLREAQREARETLKAWRARLPTDAELAREAGVSAQTIANVMERGIKRYETQRDKEQQP